MNVMKSGFLTTEFWQTLAMQILALLVLAGVVSTSDSSTIAGALTNAITAVGVLIAAMKVVVAYINGRIALKQHAAQMISDQFVREARFGK